MSDLKERFSKNVFLILVSCLLLLGFIFFYQITRSTQKPEFEGEKFTTRTVEHYLNFAPEAKYTIVEYFDFNCIFCRELHLKAKQQNIDYSKVNYILRHLPIDGNPNSVQVSVLAECVYEQSGDAGYLKFLDAYYLKWGNQDVFDWIIAIGKDLVTDDIKFNDCINNSEAILANLSNNFVADSVSGISSTPTFVVYKNDKEEETYNGLGIKLYTSLISYYSK